MLKKTILILLILVTLSGLAIAQTGQDKTKHEVKAEVVINCDTGYPTRLVISGYIDRKVGWLGISLYPYNISDYITGGTHSFLEVKQGHFQHEILLDNKYLGGSFEVGLWGKKVHKVDCEIENCYWCKIYGFHVDESLGYKSGLLTRQSGYSDQ